MQVGVNANENQLTRLANDIKQFHWYTNHVIIC